MHATFSVPSAKGTLVFGMLTKVLGEQSVRFTKLESLVGKLGALALAIPGILIKLRNCYGALAKAHGSPSVVIRLESHLGDELQELASMGLWRTAVLPWVRTVSMTIVVPERVFLQTTTHGRSEHDMVLVAYGFPEAEPGEFRVAVPTLPLKGGTNSTRNEVIGNTILFVVKKAVHRTGAASCFVTLNLYTIWRPATVFGSDLSLSTIVGARANELFQYVSQGHLVLSVFAFHRSRISRNGPRRGYYKLCLALWLPA